MDADALRARFAAHGQGHVFAFWDRLDEPSRAELLAEAAEIDLAEIDRLVRDLVRTPQGAAFPWDRLEPAPYTPLPRDAAGEAAWARASSAGWEALREGRVAAFTVAGGQGTRLGYDGPKGTFPVTPVRGRPLFAVFAEKILAIQRASGRPLHWFIMTSHQNHAATEAFFAEHAFFGLDRHRVHFFRQGRMPAVDFEGRILLETPGRIALSPDGHGGSLRALVRSGAAGLLRRENVDTLSYFQVDNPLVRCVDPAYVGLHRAAGAEMSGKMIPKAYPEEKLGHFCTLDGRLTVVEYSDLPAELARERLPDGSLRFNAGSIAIHALDVGFAARLGEGGAGTLPFHRADKKIPCVDAAGQPVRPARPNGVKFELFVFDALPLARRALVVETDRAEEFSPVKNAEGADSPATCRDDQLRQWTRWARAAGADVPCDATGLPPFAFEVSPLFGYDAASFAASWRASRPAVGPGAVLGG